MESQVHQLLYAWAEATHGAAVARLPRTMMMHTALQEKMVRPFDLSTAPSAHI
jgi:hypothetical protein